MLALMDIMSRTRYKFSVDKLQTYRTARGLTVTQLGARLDRSAFAVTSWEKGIATPPTKLLPDLARELGVEIPDLYEPVTEEEVLPTPR
jgi:transcriptional regulator with XRE-family HTH domain